MLKVRFENCINFVNRAGLIYCAKKDCQKLIGLCRDDDAENIITFINTREMIFKPHIAYSHRYDLSSSSPQRVIFMAMYELDEIALPMSIDVANSLIMPLENGVVLREADSSQTDQFVRVAAFSSEAAMNVDENIILQHFRDALVQHCEENSAGLIESPVSALNEELEKEQIFVAGSNEILQEVNDANLVGTEHRERSTENHLDEFGLGEFLVSKESDFIVDDFSNLFDD